MSNLRLTSFLLAAATIFFFFSCGNGGAKPAVDTIPQKPGDSVSILSEQIRKDPGNLDLYVRRARISMNKKDYAGALADMDHVIRIDSSKAEYLIAAADINFFTGRVSRAEQLLKRAVELHPENIDCMLRLAQMYHYRTRYEEELDLINRALHVDVHNAQAYYMKGMLYKDLHDTAKAISSLQTAVEQEPDHYNAYIQLGLLCAAQHNPLAENYYLNAININPNSEEAIYNLAMYYQENENWNRAIETYTTLLKVNPHHFDAHFNLGIIHATKLGVTDEGMKYFNLAIEDNPKEPRGYYGRGWCYQKNGDFTNAEKDYRMTLALDPDYTKGKLALIELDAVKKAGKK